MCNAHTQNNQPTSQISAHKLMDPHNEAFNIAVIFPNEKL